MKADRIVTPPPHISTKWRLPPLGWVVVYTLALLMIGAMFYFVKNVLDNGRNLI